MICWDSWHIQLAKYTVFDEESDVQVENKPIFRARRENIRKQSPRTKTSSSIHSIAYFVFWEVSGGPTALG